MLESRKTLTVSLRAVLITVLAVTLGTWALASRAQVFPARIDEPETSAPVPGDGTLRLPGLVLLDSADVIVCSATPNEALEREWEEHDIAKYVSVIAGQEMGKKAQHLDYATTGKYKENHVIMIGDAPGDLNAAKANNVLFYPINPGNEPESWKRFHDEAFDKFINGEYAGDYEAKVIAEFDSYLPELPPWQK